MVVDTTLGIVNYIYHTCKPSPGYFSTLSNTGRQQFHKEFLMQQLSGFDSLFFAQESNRTPMHITGILIYDPSTSPDKKVRFKDIMSTFENRLDLAPIFRKKIVDVPGRLDRSYWVDDPEFDIEFHMRHIALPKPGDWRQFCIQCARLHARVLDRSRPLWEAYVIEGLDTIEGIPKGSFAVLTKMHHAAVDGASGMKLVEVIHDLEPINAYSGQLQNKSWQIEAAPSNTELLARAWINSFKIPGRWYELGKNAYSALKNRDEPKDQESSAARVHTRFNTKVSSARVIDAFFMDMNKIQKIKKSVPGATVNDVAVCIVSGALRAYLDAKGELPEHSLISQSTVNVRTEEDEVGGNKVSSMSYQLFTDIADPAERLSAIHKELTKCKAAAAQKGTELETNLFNTLPSSITSTVIDAAMGINIISGAPAPYNTVISNVPGPQIPLYMTGAKLIGMMGGGLILDNQGIFHTVNSVDGVLSISVTACRNAMPDPEFYRDCIKKSYRELLRTVETGTAGSEARGSTKRKAAAK